MLLIWTVSSCGTEGAETAADREKVESPVITLPDWADVPAAAVTGALQLTSGCLVIGDAVALWPAGSMWDEQAERVIVGQVGVVVGDRIDAAGGYYPVGSDYSELFGRDAFADAQRCADETSSRQYVVTFP